MTLLVDALVVAGGLVLGRWIVRRVRSRKRVDAGDGADGGGSAGASGGGSSVAAKRPPTARELLAGFPCKLGDVVVRVAERDEAWLAGALVLEEERPVAALFVAPEAGGDRALFVRGAAGAGMTWLAPLPKGALALTSDPPHALEHEGRRYERARRLPVRVSRVGTGAPSVGERAIVAEYAGGGADRLLVVAGSDETLAWQGVALGEGEYDVLPGEDPAS